MKKVTFDRWATLSDGETYEINASEKQGCYLEIVDRTNEQLSAMLSHHRKVFVCMFVFHLGEPAADNELFSKFMRKLKKRLESSKYKFSRIGYIWVREQGLGEAQHYHLALFLDGSLVQFPQNVFELAADIWEGWNQPRPAFTPRRSYYLLRRGGDEKYRRAIYHLSYFAKTRSKVRGRKKAANDFSSSRLEPR